MSPLTQRIAIANLRGYVIPFSWHLEWADDGEGGYEKTILRDGNLRRVPDYLNDLNAMHEAEGFVCAQDIKDMHVGRYQSTLIEVCGVPYPFHAKAAQRAEAFLRTVGRWEETQ